MLGLKSHAQLAAALVPQADYGFFGPDSITWKVWSYPSTYIVGFVRAISIEHFDPNLAAAVVQAGGAKYRPHTRYTRTVQYFAMVAVGAAGPAVKAADVLVKIHSKAIGHDPVTGGDYDANRPDSQLWIHVTGWHSILKCYEMFGPGKLTEDEERQYWAECAVAAQLQTINPDQVPRTREEVRAFFEEWRPRLAASEAAQDMIGFILPMKHALPPDMPVWKKAGYLPTCWMLRKAVISTLPKHMRDMAGVRQGPLADALVRLPTKAFHEVVARSDNAWLALVNTLLPDLVPLGGPARFGVPPLSDKIWAVREAQAAFGVDIPAEAHPDLRAKQYARVFREGRKASDEGLVESQSHIGSLDPTTGS